MAMIALCCFDTTENGRSEYTQATLNSLSARVDLTKHRLIVVDNASCKETKAVLMHYEQNGIIEKVITLPENVGTARAINKAWELRNEGEHCIKMDNDVVIHSSGWVGKLVQAIERDPSIGIIGLKRKDCWENPEHDNPFYKSELKMLPHEAGQPWVVVEKVRHVMGTCQMFNSALLDKIGYLYQPTLYGFDDCLAATRSEVAGFYNAFLPHIDIDHIDTGETAYQGWKKKITGDAMVEFNRITQDYRNGKRPIFEKANY